MPMCIITQASDRLQDVFLFLYTLHASQPRPLSNHRTIIAPCQHHGLPHQRGSQDGIVAPAKECSPNRG